MTDEPLLTLRQVADELDLPESTVRYYRDAFLDHIPSIGTGRRRRYPPPAVAVLRSIAEGYATGRSHEAILGSLEGATPRTTAGTAEKPRAASRQPAGVSNLELLAAIVDGEREQRDALWQMAKEIMRLTEVLEGQEKVLTEIADHAGVRPVLAAAPPPRALGEGRADTAAKTAARAFATQAPGAPPAEAAPLPPPPLAGETPAPWAPPPPPRPAAYEPVARTETPVPAPQPPPFTQPPVRAGGAEAPGALAGAPASRDSETGLPASEMERLRSELESERQLVERLREAKLKLEHRVTDAEALLEERRPRKRSSVLGRLLNPGDE